MKKNGFVLVETVIVLVITIVAMLGLFKGYSLVFTNLKQKVYYDNINDIYKVNVFKSMKESFGSSLEVFDTSNCMTKGMNSNCSDVMNQFQTDYLIFIPSVIDAGNSSILSNSDKLYLETLTSGYKYLVMHYKKNDKDYYASLKVE